MNNIYGLYTTQPLSYEETEIVGNTLLETIFVTPDLDQIGYIIEVDLKYSDEIKQKLTFCHSF